MLPGGAGWAARVADELHERRVGAEGDGVAVLGQRAQPDRGLVVRAHALEVRDPEPDAADHAARGRRWSTSSRISMHLARLVAHVQRGDVVGGDVPLGEHGVREPVDQSAPELRVHEDDREVADLLGLPQRGRLEQLVHRPEAAGEDDEAARVAHEHDLAREEVVEVELDVDVRVDALLVRQVDPEADRRHARLARAAVGRLHDPRAAAGDDRVARVAERARHLAGGLVAGVVRRRACRAEDRDRLADVAERLEPRPQLVLDAQHALRVRELGEDRGGLRLQQLLVGSRWMAWLRRVGHSPSLERRERAGVYAAGRRRAAAAPARVRRRVVRASRLRRALDGPDRPRGGGARSSRPCRDQTAQRIVDGIAAGDSRSRALGAASVGGCGSSDGDVPMDEHRDLDRERLLLATLLGAVQAAASDRCRRCGRRRRRGRGGCSRSRRARGRARP